MFQGGFNPRQLKQMEKTMKKMGMKMEELEDVEEVVITLKDKEIVIQNPEVSIMNAMGQETYQVVGKAEERIKGSGDDETSTESISEEDIELVASQTGKTKQEAEEALMKTGGDLAEAIMRLS